MPDEQKRKPWFKFWPSDWRGDEKLRVCSLGARGLWIECLALMHKAEPYGHLLVHGKPPTMQELGKLVGATTVEASRLLAELQIKGVCDVTNGGVIVSRRMVRDKAKELRARADGERGGNPAITNKDKPTLKGHVNGTDIHAGDGRAQPDSRFQTDRNHKSTAPGGAEPADNAPEPDHKLLCALVKAEWTALEKSGRQFEGETDLSEHMKGVAAKAHVAYDGPSIATAIRAVAGSNGKRLS
jgi:hypothetical protein